MQTEEKLWNCIRDYLQTYGLVRHQRESFDVFMKTMLPYIISENSDIISTHSSNEVQYSLRFENVRIMRPSTKESDGFERSVTPSAARLRGLTYASNIIVEVVFDEISLKEKDPKLVNRTIYSNILLCRIPVMINSHFCHLID